MSTHGTKVGHRHVQTRSPSRAATRQVDDTDRAALARRVRARRPEIESAILAHATAERAEAPFSDDEYLEGLLQAVAALVNHGLSEIEQGEDCSSELPSAVLAQARCAARSAVSLDAVLISWAAGHDLLGDYLMDEMKHMSSRVLQQIRRGRRSTLERVMLSIATEYKREVERIDESPDQRQAELVRRLLDGEPADVLELRYDLDVWHLGVIIVGADAADLIVDAAAKRLDRRFVTASQPNGVTWAWLGGPGKLEARDAERVFSSESSATVSVAIGEPAKGIEGWRLTHQQARAAHRVLQRSQQKTACFADVLLLTSVLADEMITTSFAEIYLTPLDGAAPETARSTLRAYFAAGHNVRATAAMLGVDRNTVRNRLDNIERRLGYPLHSRQAELEVALRLAATREASGIGSRNGE